MSRKFLLATLLFFLAACSVRSTPSPTPAADQTTVEEQAVYAFLVTTMYQHKSYVIMSTSATSVTGVDNTFQTLDYVLQNIHGVQAGTLESFKSRNDKAYPISADMDLGSPYTLLSQTGRNQIFGENQSGWDIFYNRYPQAPGITTFSRVGLNSTFTQALVYMGTQSNWLAGSGYYILLHKVNGKWAIDQQVMVWVS